MSTCSMSIMAPLGMVMMPSRMPSSTFLPMERPSVATLRPLATAASMICCTRCMWLAKQATMMRLSVCVAKTRRRSDPDRGLRFGEAGLLGVGGVRQEQPDALGLGQLAHAREVGAATVDRLQVELEVTRVEDDALGGVEGDGERVGHRVGDRDELHVARADAPTLPVADGDEVRAVAEAGLFHPVAGQADGELGPVDRRLQVAQEVGQSPGVVLVPVGQDDAVDPVGPLPQIGELGQDQVHAGHVGVGEHDAAVEDDDAAVDLDAGAVAADLPEPAEKDDTDGRRLGA